MFVLDYDDIEIAWQGEPPPDQGTVEGVVRSNLRRYVLPLKPCDLAGYFIALPIGALIFVYGEADSETFFCTYFH